jgi:hypothetical protein
MFHSESSPLALDRQTHILPPTSDAIGFLPDGRFIYDS